MGAHLARRAARALIHGGLVQALATVQITHDQLALAYSQYCEMRKAIITTSFFFGFVTR